MAGVDYDTWADYMLEVAASFGRRVESVLDLACGTGNTSIPLAKQGCKVTGIDLSRQMLAIAEEKAGEAGLNINFLQRNMLKMEFSEPFDMVVSFQDGLNYLVGEGDFTLLAQKVKASLKPGGLFVFDLNQVKKYDDLSDGSTDIIDDEDLFMVYEYEYRKDSQIWAIRLTGFIKTGALYEKFSEYHEEKHHNIEEVKSALLKEGFKIQAVWGIFTKKAPTDDCRRILVVAERES